MGPRLREATDTPAHGFMDELSFGHAALTLRAAGLMPLVPPADAAPVDPQTIRRNLGDPLAMRDRVPPPPPRQLMDPPGDASG